jgi:chromosome segregation ATPase
LKRAWGVRERIIQANEEVQKLRVEKGILERSAHDTREGLKAIGRHRGGVSDLREKLSARLLELDQKLADLNKRLVELELSQSEQRVAFTETVRDITLKEPLPSA